jgi:hypothetical protein
MLSTARVRQLLQEHGTLVPQSASEWSGQFPLPDVLSRFYQEVGPVDILIEGYGNPFFLPRLSALWEFQAGYRWDGLTGERIEEWEDDWLVVADQGGDPFILDIRTGAILFAEHGTGEWEPDETFTDVFEMAACLGTLGSVAARAGDDFTDDEEFIRPHYRAAAEELLGEILRSRSEAETVLDTLGWG